MSLSFSQRYGYKKVRESFQIEEIDDELKTAIWNTMHYTCLNGYYNTMNYLFESDDELHGLCSMIWNNHLKNRANQFPTNSDVFKEKIEEYLFEIAEWYEIYDLLEYIAENTVDAKTFKDEINLDLENEMSGYRFIGNKIIPITDELELQTIDEAIGNSELRHASIHIKSALELMSDRENPSYRNSIKESISAVEGVAKLITNEKNITLGPALKKLDSMLPAPLHGSLKSGFLKIYGYTSDGDGIRHALTGDDNVSFEEAKFMLVACSAFVNYLISKVKTFGMEIEE